MVVQGGSSGNSSEKVNVNLIRLGTFFLNLCLMMNGKGQGVININKTSDEGTVLGSGQSFINTNR